MILLCDLCGKSLEFLNGVEEKDLEGGYFVVCNECMPPERNTNEISCDKNNS